MTYTSSAGQIPRERAHVAAMSPSTGDHLSVEETAYQTGGRHVHFDDRDRRGAHETRQPPRSQRGYVDPSLLDKARQVIESIEIDDEFDTALYLTALAGGLLEMWETAAISSETHRDILATAEAGARQAARSGSITAAQLSTLREAVSDLAQPILSPENAEFLREQFVREGFGPLGFVDDEHRETTE